MPTVLFVEEGITIRGKVLEASDYVIVYLSNALSEITQTRLVKVNKNNSFDAHITLPEKTGEYTFIIAKGKSFDTNKYATISLIGSNTILFPSLPTENYEVEQVNVYRL